VKWYNTGNLLTNASGIAIGTGKANTAAIVAMQGAGTYAASSCVAYSGGGFTDWFLPSKGELNLMYLNLRLQGIGSFDLSVGGYYWTSSEEDIYLVWLQRMVDGLVGDASKNYAYNVRPVRSY
jgi:hypothetical protein